MIRQKSNTDQNLLPLTMTSLVACALAGMAVLVSANTQVPNYPATQRFESESAFIQLQDQLHANNLKHSALLALKGLPDYYSSTPMTMPGNSLISALEKASDDDSGKKTSTSVNVNTFLLSSRISNQSRLAELQMQPFFSDFNAQRFTESANVASTGIVAQTQTNFKNIGFPHIETGGRADSVQYKPYKQLVSFSGVSSDVIVPNVKCMGLSAENVAKRAEKYDAKIFELAVKHNVSASLVKAVVAKESCFDPAARSRVGAIGLMQLMPETAEWLKVSKPENPHQNLSAGVRYLAQLRKRFGSNELALAAYNAGPGNVERYEGIPPFAETQNYVQDVMYFYRGYVATTRFVNALNDFE